jgi:hypothetical protein
MLYKSATNLLSAFTNYTTYCHCRQQNFFLVPYFSLAPRRVKEHGTEEYGKEGGWNLQVGLYKTAKRRVSVPAGNKFPDIHGSIPDRNTDVTFATSVYPGTHPAS